MGILRGKGVTAVITDILLDNLFILDEENMRKDSFYPINNPSSSIFGYIGYICTLTFRTR